MFDPADGGSAPLLDAKVHGWTVSMFRLLGFGEPSARVTPSTAASSNGSGGPPDDPDADPVVIHTEDATEARRLALSLRLDAIALSPRLPAEQTASVEQQVARIREMVAAAKGEGGLDAAEKAVADLESVVRGLNAEGERRDSQAATLADLLKAQKLPDGPWLAPSETPNLDGERLAILADLSGPIGDPELARAETAARELIDKLTIATALGQERKRRCQAVSQGFAAVQRPVGGQPGDYADYDAELPAIAAAANPPIGDGAIAAAEAALTRVKTEAERLATVFAARLQRAQAVRTAIPVPVPPGANSAEIDRIAVVEKQSLEALGPTGSAPAEAALSQAEGLLGDRATLLSVVEAAIADRVKQREATKAALDKVDLSGIGEFDGLAALQAESGAIAEALPLATDDPALGLLAQRVTAMAKAADDARAKRATAILSGLAKHPLPPDLPPEDADPLAARIDAIRKGATAPLTAAGLNESDAGLAALPKLLQDAVEALAARAKRVQDAAAAAAQVTDPKDASVAEKAALKLLREAPALTPAKPLTEAAALAAETALATLNQRHADLVVLIAAREKKRTETLDRLLVLVPPMSATGAEAVNVLKQGGALRTTVEEAATIADIDGTDAAIKALEKAIKDITDLAGARNKATKALVEAQALVKAASLRINLGCYTVALAKVKAADGLIGKATTVAEYQAAEVAISKIAAFLTDAEAYLPAMQEWRYNAELYIGALPNTSPTEKARRAAMVAWRDTLLKDADALADQAKIAEAKVKLAEFASGKTTFADPDDGGKIKDAAVDASVSAKAKTFATRVALFVTASLPTLRLVELMKLPQKDEAFQGIYEKAKKKGYVEGLWDLGIAALDTFAAQLALYKPVAEAYKRYLPLVGNGAVDAAFVTVKTECELKAYAKAGLALSGLDAGNKDAAAFKGKTDALTKRVTAALGQLAGGAKTRLETPWNQAPAQPNHSDKMAKLAETEALVDSADKMIGARDAAVALRNRLDSANAYGMLAAAEAKEGTDPFPAAEAAYGDAIKAFDRLSAYLAKVEQLAGVRTALPATATEAAKTVTDALVAADAKAKARLWDEADAALAPALALPVATSLSAELSLYLSRRKALEKVQNRLVAAIPEAAAAKQVTDPWTAAIAKAEVDHDYVAAAELLDQHRAVQATAQAYVGAATRARKGLASMKRIETSAIADVQREAAAVLNTALKKAVSDETKAKTAAAKDKTAAEKPGAKQPAKTKAIESAKVATAASKLVTDLTASLAADIASARTAAATQKTAAIYPPPNGKAKLDGELQTANDEAAKGNFAKAKGLFDAICLAAQAGMKAAAEAIEEVDNGHYVTAHGPTVTDADHKKRLTTGIRPDGKKEPTHNTSQFTDVDGMLSTRESAVEAAAAKYPATTGTTVKVGEALEYFVMQETETPVGKSFKSDSVKKDFSGGEFKETDFCENYREYGPLTRVFTKLIFHFAHPDPDVVSPKAITSFGDIAKAYGRLTPPVAPPTDLPGKWVVHQHYPTPENFDADKGAYVD